MACTVAFKGPLPVTVRELYCKPVRCLGVSTSFYVSLFPVLSQFLIHNKTMHLIPSVVTEYFPCQLLWSLAKAFDKLSKISSYAGNLFTLKDTVQSLRRRSRLRVNEFSPVKAKNTEKPPQPEIKCFLDESKSSPRLQWPL